MREAVEAGPAGVEVRAATAADFDAILGLQAVNLRGALDELHDGFLTVRHRRGDLERFGRPVPHIVARGPTDLLGYVLSMPPEHRDVIPMLTPMFVELESHQWRGRPIADVDYTVVGQVCVAARARGRGVFRALYETWFAAQAATFDLALTEIDAANERSLRAHLAVGFEEIGRHRQKTQTWVLVGRELRPRDVPQ